MKISKREKNLRDIAKIITAHFIEAADEPDGIQNAILDSATGSVNDPEYKTAEEQKRELETAANELISTLESAIMDYRCYKQGLYTKARLLKLRLCKPLKKS